MRHRHRYNLTGLPGWMRFGYSPGWVGRSPTGLGPCAQFMMSGQWPTPQMPAVPQAGPGAWMPPQPTPASERQWLESQVQVLQQQLEQINARIGELAEAEPTQ